MPSNFWTTVCLCNHISAFMYFRKYISSALKCVILNQWFLPLYGHRKYTCHYWWAVSRFHHYTTSRYRARGYKEHALSVLFQCFLSNIYNTNVTLDHKTSHDLWPLLATATIGFAVQGHRMRSNSLCWDHSSQRCWSSSSCSWLWSGAKHITRLDMTLEEDRQNVRSGLAPSLCWNSSCRSSRRALVRFSSWSWRWMFSSIRAWMVSCSSNARQHTVSSTQTHTQRRAGERRILNTSERHLSVELLQAESDTVRELHPDRFNH